MLARKAKKLKQALVPLLKEIDEGEGLTIEIEVSRHGEADQ